MTRTRRGLLYFSAGIVLGIPLLLWAIVRVPTVPIGAVLVPVAYAHPSAAAPSQRDLLALARTDPLALLRMAHERYEREVRDYRCVLIKQERLEGMLSAVQEIEVRFRNSPRAIYMLWKRNADQTKRALYKDDPAYVDANGEKTARVEPAGALVHLLVQDIYMPIHGERARKCSRRSIDECGFEAIFDLMDHYCTLAKKEGVLDLRCIGMGEVDGRPTFTLVRRLPYTGDGGTYPDARLVVNLDCQTLLPILIESYADADGQELLGRYAFTQVELNPGLSEKDFTF